MAGVSSKVQGLRLKAFCPFSYEAVLKVKSDSFPPLPRQAASPSYDQPLLLVSGGMRTPGPPIAGSATAATTCYFCFLAKPFSSPGLLQVRSAGSTGRSPREKLEIAAAGFHFTDRMHFLIRQSAASEQQRHTKY